MLLPDNIHPELSIYYNGYIVLKELKKENKQKLVDLDQKVKKINNMSFQIFVLSLDWLYLLNVAKIDKNGEVSLCL